MLAELVLSITLPKGVVCLSDVSQSGLLKASIVYVEAIKLLDYNSSFTSITKLL